MRACMEEMENLLNARAQCIWVQTYEEEAFLSDMKELIRTHFQTLRLFAWSCVEGMQKIPLLDTEKQKPPIPETYDIGRLHDVIKQLDSTESEKGQPGGSNNVVVLKDFHSFMKDPVPKRAIRDLVERPTNFYNPLVVVSPYLQIDDELAKVFQVMHYDLPDKELVLEIVKDRNGILERVSKKAPEKGLVPLDKKQEEAVADAALGLTEKEIKQALSNSITRYKTLNADYIMQCKVDSIRKTGALDFKTPRVKLSDVGGNEVLKEWLKETKMEFSPEARDFGLPMPKGVLLLGIPGCGKTTIAEAFAGELGVPFLSLNMAKVMSSLVGESEKKIEYALGVAKKAAPCVLLLDEIEKCLGGKQ